MSSTVPPVVDHADEFPRLYARTQRFTLGRPRGFRVSHDGARVWFLRSDAGDDPVHHLWLHDVSSATTARVADARDLPTGDTELTTAERARRERAREGGDGIVSFATDRQGRLACFVVGTTAFVVDIRATVVVVDTPDGAHDPRLSPDGRRIAVVVGDGVHAGVVPVDDDGLLDATATITTNRIIGPDDDEQAVTWGLAEFVAAEEMRRGRGFWWAPDGATLLVARVDEAGVATAWLADPVQPRQEPPAHRYPFAGTTNATVDLWLVPVADDGGDDPGLVGGPPVAVTGDRDHYLASVEWSPDAPALVTWQDRAQGTTTITALDPVAATCVVRYVRTGAPWTELVPGTPTWLGDRLVVVDAIGDMGPEGTHALVVDGDVVSPTGLQVRSVIAAHGDLVMVTCTRGDATSIEVVAVDVDTGEVTDVVAGAGVHAAHAAGPTRVEVSSTLHQVSTATVVRDGRRHVLDDEAFALPDAMPEVTLHQVAAGLSVGVVVPDGDGPFPILLDPYGGPHAQRVLQARATWVVPQWFARRGIAVVVTDNRGTPGRSPAFEHAIAGDLATPALDDQFTALDAVVAGDARLDGDRVAIRGWSFGGYLAALVALRRPERIRAAVVGAPVTDWHLYDTHYTERYLGHPDVYPDAYRHSSLVDGDGGLVEAVDTDHPPAMLVIHGLVDDNVLAAHSLRLSRALLAAGRPHQFLPLSGVTHMTPQEVVAANLLTTQLAFLATHLDLV